MLLSEPSVQTAAAAAAGQKVSTRQTFKCVKGALREQRISGVLGPFSSSKSFALAFVMCSDRL